jgi:hypothetical protein
MDIVIDMIYVHISRNLSRLHSYLPAAVLLRLQNYDRSLEYAGFLHEFAIFLQPTMLFEYATYCNKNICKEKLYAACGFT